MTTVTSNNDSLIYLQHESCRTPAILICPQHQHERNLGKWTIPHPTLLTPAVPASLALHTKSNSGLAFATLRSEQQVSHAQSLPPRGREPPGCMAPGHSPSYRRPRMHQQREREMPAAPGSQTTDQEKHALFCRSRRNLQVPPNNTR